MGTVEFYTQEQLEILMMVAGSEQPLETAVAVRQRWRYILAVARAAREGKTVDWSLPQVVKEYEEFSVRAERIIAALDDWLVEQTKTNKSA